MSRVFGALLFAGALVLSLPGCGGSGESTNIAEDAGQSEIEKYEAEIKAEEEAASAAMDAGLKESEKP